MTDRANLLRAERLVDGREIGGYSLPPDVVRAVETYRQLRAVAIPAPDVEAGNPQSYARTYLRAAAKGKAPELLDLAGALVAAEEDVRRFNAAGRVHAAALELAMLSAGTMTSETADEILVEHLRPVFSEVLDEASKLAPVLDGQELSDGWRAPEPVRRARENLLRLAGRLQAVWSAKVNVYDMAGLAPRHDTEHLFGVLRQRVRRDGDGAVLPIDPWPADAPMKLLALVTAHRTAGPWLPTIAEQDAKWLEVFGDEQLQRQHNFVSARANAGMSI